MDDFEHVFTELKQLSNDITEANYYDYGKQGYDISSILRWFTGWII